MIARTGPDAAREIRAWLSQNGGRAMTAFLPLPDGTAHLEPGLSIRAYIATHLMGQLMGMPRNERENYDKIARMALDGAKALLRVMKESETEVVHGSD